MFTKIFPKLSESVPEVCRRTCPKNRRLFKSAVFKNIELSFEVRMFGVVVHDVQIVKFAGNNDKMKLEGEPPRRANCIPEVFT